MALCPIQQATPAQLVGCGQCRDTKGAFPLLLLLKRSQPHPNETQRFQHSLLHCILALEDSMQLSRCLGTLQLLPIQHLLLQLLNGLKKPSSEELDLQSHCCTTFLP